MNKMNKTEIIDSIASKKDLRKKDVEAVLDAFAELVNNNERVAYPKFGVFRHKVRPPRIAWNPITGETVQVPERTVLVFKASKANQE